MSKEVISTSKVRKSNHPISHLGIANDKDIRIIKIPAKKENTPPANSDPFSGWNMPPQPDGYLKSTHKDCL